MRIYTLDGKCNLSCARVKEARLRLGLSQEDLAVKLQLPGHWAKNNPPTICWGISCFLPTIPAGLTAGQKVM